jgi:transposase
MIVIGVDVHKHSLTAVAVDDAGRLLDEKTVVAANGELFAWAGELDQERLWALEDCRQLTRWLERELLAAGEQLVRVPPKLLAPERRAGRARGKSDPIDALAVARAALREPGLNRPRPDEQPFRELKLLVDHREDLVDERRRAQQRLRWHLHQLDPSFAVPARRLDRTSQLDRVSRWLARREQEIQVRIARDLVSRCRTLTRSIVELDRELEQRTAQTAPALLELPGCGTLTAAKPLAEVGPIDRFHTDAQLARHSGVAPLEASSGRVQRHRLDRGGNRPLNAAFYRIAITQARYHPAAPRLPRTQTSRRQKPTRSDPLPQTLTRTCRLQHTQNEPRLDIGATLALPRVPNGSRDSGRRSVDGSTRTCSIFGTALTRRSWNSVVRRRQGELGDVQTVRGGWRSLHLVPGTYTPAPRRASVRAF